MMQDGLHIGLAAWINAQRNTGSFAVYPALPIVTALVDLQAIRDIHDLAKAAEFARLVNFVPRQGQVADTFSASACLWEIHRGILDRMDFATEPWTSAERAQYQAARDVLYTTDAAGRPGPSDRLLLYEEMKNAYRDLQETGGSVEDLAQAMANWMVLGHKQLIEDARETIVRLSSRSTRIQAEDERASLEDVRLSHHGDLSFASTYFAPISAVARETWMEAKVSFEGLDRAVGNSPATGKWKAYLANRAGEVSFDYIVLNCIRPWYTPALYQADDWKLSTEGTIVSKGNGADGLLPAYVDAVYLVSVKNVTTQPMPPPPTLPLPISIFRPLAVERAHLFPATERPRSLGHGGPSTGIVGEATASALLARERLVADASDSVPVHRPARPLAAAEPAVFLTARGSGAVRRVTAVDVNQRLTLAHAYLVDSGRPAAPSAEPTSSLTYVAGFGCEKVPFAPNPNVNYQW
jgi:hypothetical protein